MKKVAIASVVLAMFFSCQKPKMKEEIKTNFFVGTYTKAASKGIYKYQIDLQGHLKNNGLVAATNNPSFLAKTKDNKTLLAVDETSENGTGYVNSYTIKKDTLEFVSRSKSGGDHPCFVTINNKNKVLVANYTGGNVGLLNVDESGKLSSLLDVQQHFGKGTTDRQKEPHAHSTWFHPTKKEVISVDLGTNQLWFSKVNEQGDKLILSTPKTLNMQEGAGPRHLTFHPNNKWIYVFNELNNTISLVKEQKEFYVLGASVSTLPKDYNSSSYGADIHVSKDGKFLYASNRGHNSIAIFKVNLENGTLKAIGFESVLGKNPRNFSLTPDDKFLLVANQDTNNIVSFKRDSKTGTLTFVDEIEAFTPVCILF